MFAALSQFVVILLCAGDGKSEKKMKKENASVRHLVSDYGAVFFRFCAMHGLAMFCFVVFLRSLFL